jgi:hypothetical protein
MTATTSIEPAEEKSAQLARYGILRVATEHFTVGGYRYSKIEDAVAEAKRRLASSREGS